MKDFIIATADGSTKELFEILDGFQPEKPKDYLAFLAPARIKKVRSIIGDPEKLKDIKRLQGLWKDILIDAIFFLRVNDHREKTFWQDSNKDIKTTMLSRGADERAKANVYGIDELYKYFEMFTEFEHTLYGADKFYRDHLLHPIMVWIIGLNIIKEFGENFRLRVCKYIKLIGGSSADLQDISDDDENNKIDKLLLSTAELSAMWAVIALTHDLGYPLEKVDKINDQLEKMLAQFGKIGFSRSRFTFETQHDHLVRFLLSFISSVAKPIDVNFGGTNIENEKAQSKSNQRISSELYRWITHKRTKYFTKFSKSWEMFDHGIVSSLILLKSLTFFIESDHSSDFFEKLKHEDARQFSIRSEILHAIAAHTTSKIYHLSTNNLPFLLILCDELQEWSRPTLSDMRAGIKGNANKVTIKKIDMKKDDSSSIHCLIEYTKYKALTIPRQKEFVTRIFRVWAERFRPALDDRFRSIEFVWDIKFGDDQVWSFELKTENDVLKQFITKGPTKDDPDGQIVFDLYENVKKEE